MKPTLLRLWRKRIHPHSASLFEDALLAQKIFNAKEEETKCSCKPSPPWRGEVDDTYVKTTWGGFRQMKEKLIAVVHIENDDKNYRKYKSATQQQINSSNAVWYKKSLHE